MTPSTRKPRKARKQAKNSEESKKENTNAKDISNGRNPFKKWQNMNAMHHLMYQYQMGCCTTSNIKQAVIKPYQEKLATYRVLRTSSPFDRRVTSMAWHPTKPTTMCVGSKSGDLVLWDYEKLDHSHFVRGIGKGGSISAVKFDLDSPDHVYTSSLDGIVQRQDFEGRSRQVFLSTNDLSFWYCGMDVNFNSNLVVTGDNIGRVNLLTRKEGEKVWCHRLHKQKVNHCEFNPVCDWLFATASVDKTVKLWDVRMIKDNKGFIHNLQHEKPVNSAYFSPDGSQLLTTDQHHDIRIYSGPYWSHNYKTILHPHRFFQHITPIRAAWHPVHDVIVVGRYPDPSFPGYREGECRTVDIFDANSGNIICQLLDPSAPGIITLNTFSPMTDALFSAMGYHILVWTGDDDAFQRRQKLMETLRANNPRVGGPSSLRRQRRRDDNDDDDVGTLKKKLKRQTGAAFGIVSLVIMSVAVEVVMSNMKKKRIK